jgi:DNA-directed RNA polymerase sigma subunit (sigma70/sigma32)
VVSEAAKLQAELERLLRLRAWVNDKLTQERLAQLIKETEERLRQLESATGDRDA